MRYRCPLCLKPLDRDDQLWKFCPQHPDVNSRPLNPYDPDEEGGGFFCAERGCVAHERFHPDGLIYRHQNCRLETSPGTWQPLWNPFWSGSGVHVEDRVIVLRDGKQDGQKVHHWQLHALRQAHVTGAQEMWFPAGLLVTENGPPHTLVSFSGAKGVGKTYLAMRMLDPNAYATPPRPVEDFLYLYSQPLQAVAPAAEYAAGAAVSSAVAHPSATEFLQTLYMREMLRHADLRHFEEALNSTGPRPRNVKAAMFPNGPAAVSDIGGRTGGHELSRGAARFAFRAGEFLATVGERLKKRGHRPHRPYRGLVLYDLAGEAVEEGHVDVRRHDEAMDVLAIVLSADHLTSAGKPQPLGVASDRIAHAEALKRRDDRLRCCLIVTKCDLWPVRPGPKALLRALRDLSSHSASARIAQEVATAGRQGATLDEVLFTWRESGESGVDVVRGLDEFAAWCLR